MRAARRHIIDHFCCRCDPPDAGNSWGESLRERLLEVVRLLRQKGQTLKAGDVIVSVARQPVPDPPALFALLGGDRIARPTPVEVVRGGRRLSVTVTPWRLES